MPLSYQAILSASEQYIVFDSDEETKTLNIDIDISAFDDLNYFQNNWSIYCANSSEIEIVILELSILCNEDVSLDLIESQKIYSLQIQVLEWNLDNIHDCLLYTSPSPRDS